MLDMDEEASLDVFPRRHRLGTASSSKKAAIFPIHGTQLEALHLGTFVGNCNVTCTRDRGLNDDHYRT